MREILAERPGTPNRRTVVHWITVFMLSLSGLLTALTGIYFLFLPSGGYQGGTNPHYGQTFLFDRDIWVAIHTWAGIAMVAVSLLHIVLHWQWVVEMGRRSLAVVRGKRKSFNRKIWIRLAVITAIGLVFVGVAASGIYFFVLPGGQGNSKAVQFLFSRSTWDLVHTWAGILMIIGAIVHLAMRWKWVSRVTPSVARTLVKRREYLAEGRSLVITRIATLLVLVAISGLLVYGGIYRTESVLASERRDAGAASVQGSGTHGNGHGNGSGTGQGAGRK